LSAIGFRRWRVSGSGELVALRVPHVWTSCTQTAECKGIDGIGLGNCAPWRVRQGHPAPSLRSRCGIWAHKLPIRECMCGDPASASHGVVGAVRLWGRYVEHETGWRAEHARVVALVDFTGRLDQAYDVPRYRDLASMYSEWATDPTGWAPGESGVWCDPDLAMPFAVTFLQFAAQFGADFQRTVHRAYTAVEPELRRLVDRLTRPAEDQERP
jgi:hypothetical protein